MNRKSPTLEGFRIMLRQPVFSLAEITWRWSLGLTGSLLFAFAFIEYLRTLPVTAGDLLLIKTRQPALIAKALARILHGSGARVVETLIVALLSWAVAWVIVGGFARMATLRALLAHFRNDGSNAEQTGSVFSLFALNFLRVAVLMAALIACQAPGLAVQMGSGKNPDPTLAFLAIIFGLGLIACAWSVLNWFLSLASIFVVARGEDTFGAIATTVAFCRNRFGAVAAVSTWFGLAHLTAFVIATFCSLFVFGLLGALPVGFAFLGMTVVTLIYFAVADLLHVGRLAGYVAILELPEIERGAVELPPMTLPPAPETHESRDSRVDPDELILSDVPVS
jgi:hypothetical protein